MLKHGMLAVLFCLLGRLLMPMSPFQHHSKLPDTTNLVSLDEKHMAVPGKALDAATDANSVLGAGMSNDAPIVLPAVRTNMTRYVNWIHIQKTGTSLFNMLFLHFCPRVVEEDPDIVKGRRKLFDNPLIKRFPPDKFCDVEFYAPAGNKNCPGCHWPYIRDVRSEPGTRQYFTMLRDPMERLKSAYSFGLHLSRMNDPNISFATYLNESHIPNCQLKMILGHSCEVHVPPSRLNVSLALERISSPWFFFGNTDRWSESVCLFHKWYGGEPRAFEMVNNRKTKRKDLSRERHVQFAETAFYNEAMKLFDSRLVESGCLNQTLEFPS